MNKLHKHLFDLRYLAIAAAIAAGSTIPMIAHAEHTASQPAPAQYRTAGEVKKVDAQTGRITLKHEDIKNLDMPGMTMMFQATDKTMLNDLKPGDQVEFRAEKEGSKFVVTDIKRMK